MPTLEIRDLDKRYRSGHQALQRLSLEMEAGVLGLLGPNGAGKTTLMNIISTVLQPSAGEVLWNGRSVRDEPDSLRSVLGYLPQHFGVYPNLTAPEFLDYLAAVKGLERQAARRRIDGLLDLVNLGSAKDRPLRTFSGGMRQRVGIAQALLNDPQLLIVDEPTVGLDPEERIRFRNLITDLADDRIVILSTHIVSDVEMAATSLAILKQGQLLGHRSPEAWLAAVDGQVWSWIVSGSDLAAIQAAHPACQAVRRSDGVHLRIVASEPPAPEAKVVTATLEDAYMAAVADQDPQ